VLFEFYRQILAETNIVYWTWSIISNQSLILITGRQIKMPSS